MSLDYEQLCLQRSKENQAKLKELFPNGKIIFDNDIPSPTSNRTNAAKSRRRSQGSPLSPRSYPTRRSKRTRLTYENNDEDYIPESDEESEDEFDNGRKSHSSMIRWPGRLTKQRSFDLGSAHSDDENLCELKFKKKRRSLPSGPRVPFTKRPFEAIKEEDLDAVALTTSEKRYDSVKGSSCHQCRQKTDDLKTVCRSSDCLSVARGQFCGPCLKNRYGEDAKEAIMNPEWVCPPCRGICNCSFCMKKRGYRATGILIHVAKNHGFSDVKSFLGDFKDCSSDSEEE